MISMIEEIRKRTQCHAVILRPRRLRSRLFMVEAPRIDNKPVIEIRIPSHAWECLFDYVPIPLELLLLFIEKSAARLAAELTNQRVRPATIPNGWGQKGVDITTALVIHFISSAQVLTPLHGHALLKVGHGRPRRPPQRVRFCVIATEC